MQKVGKEKNEGMMRRTEEGKQTELGENLKQVVEEVKHEGGKATKK